MESDLFWVMFGALVAGVIVGAIPGFYGVVKGRIGLGLLGFICCVIAAFAAGVLLAIPIAIVFVYYIHKKSIS